MSARDNANAPSDVSYELMSTLHAAMEARRVEPWQVPDLEEPEQQFDPVSRPAHYCRNGVVCREVERALLDDSDVLGIQALLWMDAFEYLWRWDKKGGVQDLRKARECIDELIAEVESVGA